MKDLFQRICAIVLNPETSAKKTTGSDRSKTTILPGIGVLLKTVGVAAIVSLSACGVQPNGGGYSPSYAVNGNQLVGGAIGAVGGGFLGNMIGGGSGHRKNNGLGNIAATGAGVLLGAVLGSEVGGALGYPQGRQGQQAFFQNNQQQQNYSSNQQPYLAGNMFPQGSYPPPPVGFIRETRISPDQTRLRHALMTVPVGSSVNFRDPVSGYVETYTITYAGQDGNGNVCRRFHADVISGGRPTTGNGTICQDVRNGGIHLSSADENLTNRFAEITDNTEGQQEDGPVIRMG